MIYKKPEIKSYSEEDFLIVPTCQYTGSLNITFRQTAMLNRPAMELKIHNYKHPEQKLVKLA